MICLLLCQNCFSKNIEELLAAKADSLSQVMQFESCAPETTFTSSGLSELVLPQQLISMELPNVCWVEDCHILLFLINNCVNGIYGMGSEKGGLEQ